MICFEASEDITNMRRIKGPLVATAHKAGCGISKRHDQVLFVKIITELETYHIYESYPNYISSSSQSISDIKFHSIIQ
jgi:hypothetical protein